MRKSIGEKKRPCRNCEGKGTLKKGDKIVRCQRCGGLGSSRHSSSKFFGASPNDFKIMASSKFPMFRVAATLEGERTGVCRVPRHRFGPPDRGSFIRHLLRYAGVYTFLGPHKWQSYIIYDCHCCLRRPTRYS